MAKVAKTHLDKDSTGEVEMNVYQEEEEEQDDQTTD